MRPPSNSITFAIPTEAKPSGVMSRQVDPSSEVHRMLPKAPSVPMATRPSPPGTTLVIVLALADSGTVAVPHSTAGGVGVVGDGDSAGSLGAGVVDGLCGADEAVGDGDGVAVCVLHAAMTVSVARVTAIVTPRRQSVSVFMSASFLARANRSIGLAAGSGCGK